MFLRQLFTDVRFAGRLLRRNPVFSAVLLAVLALGIGVTTAMFSVVNSVLLRPLPYPHPEELTVVSTSLPRVQMGAASIPDFLDWKAGGSTFSSMAAIRHETYTLTSEGSAAESLLGVAVSGDF